MKLKHKITTMILALSATHSLQAEPQLNRALSGQYYAGAPVDINNDNTVRICLNQLQSNCDYGADQYGSPYQFTEVNIPMHGQLVIPHQITHIYSSDQLPIGIDTQTNAYLQKGQPNGPTGYSYQAMDNGFRKFSDYLSFTVDSVNRQTIISWYIPRNEGQFGNVSEFSNQGVTHWHIDLVAKGFPYFRGRRESNFTIRLSSDADSSSMMNWYYPVLPTLKLEYSTAN